MFKAILLLFMMLPLATWAQVRPTVHVVLDIDGTLVYTTSPEALEVDSRNSLQFEEELYRLSENAVDFLIALHTLPGVEVSFFSGGSKDRNDFLLARIYRLIDQKTKTRGLYRPFRIFNVTDLEVLKKEPSKAELRFSDLHRKRLGTLGFPLDSTILVDDISKFAAKGEEKNLLWIGSAYDDFPNYEWLEKTKVAGKFKYVPASKEDWIAERFKLSRVIGIVAKALENTQASPGETNFVDAVSAMTKNKKGEFIARTRPDQLSFLKTGMRLIYGPCPAKLKRLSL